VIKRDQIPDEAIEAACGYAAIGDVGGAIAAALNAWPASSRTISWDFVTHEPTRYSVLPLKNDD
jgi:hypothetical protein